MGNFIVFRKLDRGMELEQKKIDLIKKIITSDKKYVDNEDLFDDFFNETCKRSFLIVKSIKNEVSLEAYLRKVATTSIINVLKDSGRIQRVKEGFVPVVEKSLEEIVSVPDNKYSDVSISYDIVDLSDGPEEVVIKKEVQQKLYDSVVIANASNPSKLFLQLYHLRYVKGLKQKEIAQELNITQGEVSKRLLELMEEVKKIFDNS